MIRFVFRLAALVALAVAVVLAVIDATRSIAASAWVLTPLAESWAAVAPDSLDLARARGEAYLPGVLWDPAATAVLAAPGFVVFAGLALLLYAVGRRPERRRRRIAARR